MVNTRRGYRLKLSQPRSINVRLVLAQLPTDQCVEWPGTRDKQGYGVIASHMTHLAHRWIWIMLHGVPELPELDHLCRNRACCNPAHLEPVTSAENARRRVEAHLVCSNGHAYGPDTYIYHGIRMCRQCRRANDRKRQPRVARANQKEVAA